MNECLPYESLESILSTLEELHTYKDVDAILDKLLLEARHIAHADFPDSGSYPGNQGSI